MEQDSAAGRPDAILSAAELKLRRYEATLGFWKVVLGTFIVGLAGVLIPGAIQLYTAHFENVRKETELKLSQQAAYQQYIKDFFATAINQDIELRIRFADYFANLAGPDQEQLWKSYLKDLKTLRDDKRNKINELEKQLVDFKKRPLDRFDNAEFDRVNRELAWANAEIGYVPTERSTVVSLPDNNPIGRKLRLYKETTDLVQRMALGSGPLLESDLARFWTLYRKDLIGVESPEFARIMIAIGQILPPPDSSNQPSDRTELKPLAEDLLSISRQELADVSQAAVQQQQQQQQQSQ